MTALLTPRECDHLLRYPRGRSLRLARVGKLPCVELPDGEVRFDREAIEALLRGGVNVRTPAAKGGDDDRR